ncbi:MAG: DUF1579 family protein [Candidatus Sulfotelmatobacter sp.]|jgi:hypothetical protein
MKPERIILAALILAGAAIAQTKPGPELKKLDIFVGTWTLNGNMKAGAAGAGGTMIENNKCDWMEGGFYLVCHSDYKGTMGSGTGLSVMGYSAEDKAYTFREFESDGEFVDSRGKLDGETWTWTNDENMNGTTVKGRFTIQMTSGSSYTYAFDMSQDGTKWSTVMEGKATKK